MFSVGRKCLLIIKNCALIKLRRHFLGLLAYDKDRLAILYLLWKVILRLGYHNLNPDNLLNKYQSSLLGSNRSVTGSLSVWQDKNYLQAGDTDSSSPLYKRTKSLFGDQIAGINSNATDWKEESNPHEVIQCEEVTGDKSKVGFLFKHWWGAEFYISVRKQDTPLVTPPLPFSCPCSLCAWFTILPIFA